MGSHRAWQSWLGGQRQTLWGRGNGKGQRQPRDKPKEWICRHDIIPKDDPRCLGQNIRRLNRLKLSFRTPPSPEEYDMSPRNPNSRCGVTSPEGEALTG